MRRLLLPLFLFLAPAVLIAAAAFDAEAREAMLAKLAKSETALTAQLAQAPENLELLSQRGDARLFLERFAQAIADYEKMITLDPAQDAPHWRLGIAYYFAGEFGKSARQFEKYHALDGKDRENGIWKFLAQVRVDGLEKARGEMLVYTRFDREPFPALYEMFAGKRTGDDVLAEVRQKGLETDQQVMFFARYYVAVNEWLLGRRERARTLLREAVEGGWKADKSPSFMWQVARVQAALWDREALRR